jgi:hypothetical protein
MGELKTEYDEFAKRVVKLLDEKNHNEWIERYKGYIDSFNKNETIICDAFKKFGSTPNLGVYLSTSKVSDAKKGAVIFDLRYEGRSVAELEIGQEPTFTIKNSVSDYEGFDNILSLPFEKNLKWKHTDGKLFRNFFAANPKPKDGKNIKERKFEVQLLKNFSIKSSENKLLWYVQPINLFGGYFQFPTPLSASKVSIIRKNNEDDSSDLDYAKDRGGHIDILARQGRGDNAKLTVIELKDQCSKSEPPQQAIKQAIAYAVFMQRLLRCADADNIKWWKFLGFYRDLTEDEIKDRLEKRPIRIQAVIAMPEGDYCKTEFAGKKIKITIPETKDSPAYTDFIELHYMYFKHEAGTIIEITRTSLGFQH